MTYDPTDGQPLSEDRSTPENTAKLALYKLTDGGVRFIIMRHPSNEPLAHVDLTAESTRTVAADLLAMLELKAN